MIVYLSEYIHPKAEAWLRQQCHVVTTMEEPEKIDAIILRNIEVDRQVMERCTNLKVIGKHGVGCNTIDLEEARCRGITVLNTPAANTNSVAELIVGLILDAARHVTAAHDQTQQGAFSKIAPATMTGMEITGKTLGLIGTGNIARRTAQILQQGFGMKVLGYDPYVDTASMERLGYQKIDTVKELIAASDVVNISVPLTPGTKNLIAGDVFDCFKKGAVLVNAARGGIVNEEDLYEALKSGKLRAAACDAFVLEPPTRQNTRLFELDNFIGTPHIGACTEEALERVGDEVVREVIAVLNGGEPANRVV